MTWEPACMSAAEYRDWQEMNLRIGQPNMRASSPCRDCPLWFRELSTANGCCNATSSGRMGRPLLEDTPDRRRWREAQRRKRARRAACASAK